MTLSTTNHKRNSSGSSGIEVALKVIRRPPWGVPPPLGPPIKVGGLLISNARMRLITVASHAEFALTIPVAGGAPPPCGGGSGAFLFHTVIRAVSACRTPLTADENRHRAIERRACNRAMTKPSL